MLTLNTKAEKKVHHAVEPERQSSQETAREPAAHVENALSNEAAEMQLKSLYDHLSRWETIKRFKKVRS